jgi:membrane protease YdiL (CAAX protease family)
MLSPKPWRWEAVLQLLAGIFACMITGVFLADGLRHFAVPGFKTSDSFGMILAETLSLHGAALVLIYFFLRQQGVSCREALGWGKADFKRLVMPILGTITFILVAANGLQMVCFTVLTKLGYPPKPQEAVQLFANAGSMVSMVYLTFFAVVLAPVAEEFCFRGILYPFIKQAGYPKLAWIGVSFMFALIHGSLPIVLPLFVFALAQTWLYETTDCLLAPMVTHALFNLTNLAMMFAAEAFSNQAGGQP